MTTVSYPTQNATAPANAGYYACQCPECLAYGNGYSYYPAPQPTAYPKPQSSQGFTHSPYAFPIKTEAIKPQMQLLPTPNVKQAVDSISSSGSYEREMGGLSDTDSSSGDSSMESLNANHVTVAAIQQTVGRVVSVACSSHGSSFLQHALQQYPIEAFETIVPEIQSQVPKLLLDMHACYVVKAALEMMDRESALAILAPLAENQQALITLCTRDLHSRRMVQFILDFCGPERTRYLFDLVMSCPMQLVRTQQGCITLQRILDHVSREDKEMFFNVVRRDFMEFALDPFGNYIIQYMFAEGDQISNSDVLAACSRGQVHNMACHRYASNVVEKCFGFITPELQHDIIEELFMAPDFAVTRILTDNSANYVVQAAIRAASQRDIQMIAQRLSPLLVTVPYGKKIQQKINRRLRGQ